MLISLFQPAYSFFSIVGIFLCTVICIADQETTSAAFVIFNHLAVALGLLQYPAFDLLTFILYLRTYYILVAVRFKFRYIGIVHQSESATTTKFSKPYLLTNSFIVGSIVWPSYLLPSWMQYAEWIAAKANKQAEYDLRITVSSLFRKACLAQVVLIIRFKVKCGDIIEQHTDIATKQFRSMAHAYVLYYFVLMTTKLVKIAIDFG